MKSLRRIALLAAAVAGGTAAAQTAGAAAPGPFEFRIDAGKAEEICVPLDKGYGFEFSFRADAPVDFNVHYHAGKKVVMPVDARAVSRQADRFVAGVANTYCMMWTAPKQAAAGVVGHWQLLARQP